MSIHWMNLVLERAEPVAPRERLVLLALADRADEAGLCWPGVAWIARRVAASERSVQRCLAKLEGEGWLHRRTNEGPGERPDRRTSMYYLVAERGDKSVIPLDERGDICGQNGVTSVAERGDKGVTLSVSDTSERSVRGGLASPTLAEWLSVTDEMGMDVLDAEGAWNHYEANGWRQASGQRIRNWRAAARTCAIRGGERGGGRSGRVGGGKNFRGGAADDGPIDLSRPHAHTGGVAPAVPDEAAGPSIFDQGLAKLVGGAA